MWNPKCQVSKPSFQSLGFAITDLRSKTPTEQMICWFRDLKIKFLKPYMGKHLSLRGGIDFEGPWRDLGGEPKESPSLRGESENLTNFRGESSHSGGRIGLKFSKGGEYFAKEYPSWRGGISIENFSGGGYPLDSFRLARVCVRAFQSCRSYQTLNIIKEIFFSKSY